MSTIDPAVVVRKLRHNDRLANDEARALEDLLHTAAMLVEQFEGDSYVHAANWRMMRRRFLEYFDAPVDKESQP